MIIKTRLAPSPTGPLHLGTARTALFNFLFAQQNKGKFLLRFEDTDAKRSKKEFEDDIVAGLKWLGLNWDGEIIYQSDRIKIYHERAEKLLANGSAYRKEGAIWFRIQKPESGNQIIKFDDLIRGKISFDVKDLKDFVLVRSDGIPLFMLTNVVDDYEIDKVTHVLRGEDHITNTAYQLLIAEALGYDLKNVSYGHIPLIFNRDRTKMSKRKNPVSITRDFRDKGYLPEAIVNYLALLGWNPGEKSEVEFFLLDELIEKFSLEHVGRSPSVFERERLNYFNRHYIGQLSLAKLKTKNSKLKTRIKNLKLDENKLVAITKERATTLNEIEILITEILELPSYDRDLLIFKKSNLEKTKKGLQLALDALKKAGTEKWQSTELLKNELEKIVAKNILTNGDVFWPVRVALSGREKSNPPQELLWALGKEEGLKRIKRGTGKL